MDPNIGEDSRWSFCPDVQSVMLEMGKKNPDCAKA